MMRIGRYSLAKTAKKPVPHDPLLFVPRNQSCTIKVDLQKANIPIETAHGKVDFHACRVAYVSLVLEAGAGAKEAQVLARHATANLTMNVYARTRDQRLADITEAVGSAILSSVCETCATPQEEAQVSHCSDSTYAALYSGSSPASGTTFSPFFTCPPSFPSF